MLQNYIKLAWRNIVRHKFISAINISGLAIGLTCCLLITAYIVNELSYDKFNANADRTYRVTRIFYDGNGAENLHLSAVAPPFGPLLKTAFPDIEKMTRVLSDGTAILKYKDKLFNERDAYFADENFPQIFSLNIVKGDRQNALLNPYSLMMTPELAKKYFGDEDPINKSVIIDNTKHAFTVTGIFNPFPVNAHMHPNMLMSFSTLRDTALYGEKQLETNFGNNAFYTYLLFPKNYNVASIEKQLPSFLDNYVHFPGAPQTYKTSKGTALTLQKLTDIHLRSHLDDEIENNGDIKRIYIFSVIALFILIIACINYMNLSSARSVIRAKEIGVRKVVGAQRSEIIRQFLGESVLITWIALLIAIMLSAVLLPGINKISGLNLSLQSLLRWQIIVPLLLLPFIVGIISGIYPAIFMSSFKPISVLKGVLKVGTGSVSFRKALVVVQFGISIFLIVATAVVFKQLRYMQQTSLGFNKDYVVDIGYDRSLTPRYDAFRNDLLRNPAIKEIGRSSRIPSGRLLDGQGASFLMGAKMQPSKIDIKCLATDYGFIPAYGMQMAAGRNFSKDYVTDTANFIINETAVKALGWGNADKAIGRDMTYGGTKGKIIGVVKDFHFESLHQNIIPLVFFMPSHGYYYHISIKVSGNNLPSALAAIQSTWRNYLPNDPYEYSFVDDQFQKLYTAEQQQESFVTIFSCIAIFIACLGLFGLSSFTISQRIKEIGVRKVLGASIPQIVAELSKDFMKLVLIASALALAGAWWAMDKWLQDFAYRVNIGWVIFILAPLAALLIAFATIGFQSVKAALVNPVKSLRSE
ncbi:MAG: ABC transporter permease [Mucilaginibacter sp.]